MRRIAIVISLGLAALVAPLVLVAGTPAAAALPIPGAPSCTTAPADSHWHADVSRLPVDPESATYVASAGAASQSLHADFGAGLYDGGPIGIPFTTVPGTQPKVPITFDYDDESDPGPYPIPPTAPIEGGPASGGDRHVLVVDRRPLPAVRGRTRRTPRAAAPAGPRGPGRCGTSPRTRCAAPATRRPTPPASRSSRASSATTRSPRG